MPSNTTNGLVCILMGGAIGVCALLPFLLAARSSGANSGVSFDATPRSDAEQAGRYLVRVAGCNDCHTPGFMQPGSEKIPESQWLIGQGLGFKGPWGVSYPANLRTKVQAMSEDQWVTFTRNANGRPPMPWASLHAFSERDLRNIYRYIHSLGPSDNAVPPPLDPGQAPTTPYIVFEPVMPH